MSRVAFKQCDLQRVIRAAKAEGYPNPVVDILLDGTYRLLTEPPASVAPANDAEADLDAELEAWRRKNGDG